MNTENIITTDINEKVELISINNMIEGNLISASPFTCLVFNDGFMPEHIPIGENANNTQLLNKE